mgnify:CR=1 FL=1
MKTLFALLIISFPSVQNMPTEFVSNIHRNDLFQDGPYIFKSGNVFKAMWIEDSFLREELITERSFSSLKSRFNFLFGYDDLERVYSIRPDYNQSHKNADSIAVISDIHGEFNSYIRILQSSGVIDKNFNWNFGKGHLVVLGDVFDRGDQVTEVLWHLFGLEKQAEASGGKVHMILGNHELMMFRGNMCDLNEKYRKVELLTSATYTELFSEEAVLGRWLRSKPVMISIGDILFVHGGISPEMIKKNLSVKQTNRLFLTKILGKAPGSILQDEDLMFINNASGPLWYRGYFESSDFCKYNVDSILRFYNKRHIVVGHTPGPEIRSLHNCKVMGIDSGMMYKRPGEILFIINDHFYRVTCNGTRISLN